RSRLQGRSPLSRHELRRGGPRVELPADALDPRDERRGRPAPGADQEPVPARVLGERLLRPRDAFYGTEYTLGHLGLPAALRGHIEYGFYPSGHMVYLNDEARRALKADLVRFYHEA